MIKRQTPTMRRPERPGIGSRAGLMLAAFAIISASATVGAEHIEDQRITDAVEREFLFDGALSGSHIPVSCNDGIVTLSGEVDNLMAKRRSARIARTVKGVHAVINRVVVDPLVQPTSSQLEDDVEAAWLVNPATDSYEIDADATPNGVVTIRGKVQSYQEKELAESIAAGIQGVTDIRNAVHVVYRTERNDIELENEIRETLRWNALIDDSLIEVTSEDGDVSLNGTVGSAAEKDQARLCAWVAGVNSVSVDDLEVKLWARDPMLRLKKYGDKDDADIREALAKAFLFDPRVESSDVTPLITNGIVTLTGTVPTLQASRAAEQDARNTVGVVEVHNIISVEPYDGRSPSKVERDIARALDRNPYTDRYEISIDVNDGTATLHGVVDSYFERTEAEDVAARVKGVQEVDNEIVVEDDYTPYVYDPYVDFRYGYGYTSYPQPELESDGRTDREIADAIESEFFWSPFVDGGDIIVTVEDGTATLTGTVDSWRERLAARENAYEGGATSVDNKLIKP